MRYAIAILLGNTKTFHKAYYIAAGKGGGLKLPGNAIGVASDYIAARNGGGLKQRNAITTTLYCRRKRRGMKGE